MDEQIENCIKAAQDREFRAIFGGPEQGPSTAPKEEPLPRILAGACFRCGGQGVLGYGDHWDDVRGSDPFYWAHCEGCGLSSPEFVFDGFDMKKEEAEKLAADWWEVRPPVDERSA